MILKRRQLARFLLLLIVAIIIIGLPLVFIRYFTIKHIEVKGDAVLFEYDANVLGNNLLFLPSGRIKKELLSAYPVIKSLDIEKKFPDTLLLTVSLYKPLSVFSSTSGNKLLTETGLVIGDAREEDFFSYPVVYDYPKPLFDGVLYTEPLILSVLRVIREFSLSAKTDIYVMPGDSYRLIIDNVEVVFPSTKEVFYLKRTLQALLQGFRIKGTLPKQIDLRYDNPVIKL
jgi:hypothetical protein